LYNTVVLSGVGEAASELHDFSVFVISLLCREQCRGIQHFICWVSPGSIWRSSL